MTYDIRALDSGAVAVLSGGTREELFLDAIGAALEMAYGGPPPDGRYEGQVVPVQAVGDDDGERLLELVRDCLEAARSAPGTLHLPRWMSFDERRVTANLPVTLPRTTAREISLPDRPGGGPPFVLEFHLPHPEEE